MWTSGNAARRVVWRSCDVEGRPDDTEGRPDDTRGRRVSFVERNNGTDFPPHEADDGLGGRTERLFEVVGAKSRRVVRLGESSARPYGLAFPHPDAEGRKWSVVRRPGSS
jgi:hypothetical protein